jgi:membrane protease YdiL (CAAX protease family)
MEQDPAAKVARAAAERTWGLVGVTLLLGCLVAVAAGVSARWLYGLTWHHWGCGPVVEGKLGATVCGAFLGFFLLVPMVLAIHQGLTWWFAYQHDTLDVVAELKAEGRWSAVAVTCFYAAVWTPLVEELVFRVMIQGYAEQCLRHGRNFHRWVVGPLTPAAGKALGLEQVAAWSQVGVGAKSGVRDGFGSWGFWTPIVISSLLFALAHSGQGAAPIPLYVLALGLGFLYKTTGNLFLCVLIHAMLNGLTLVQLVWH